MVLKKNFRDLITLGTSNLGASVIISFFWLFLASILAKTEYGELGFLMSIVNVGSVVALLGMRSTIVVFEAKNQNVFPSSFVVILISSSITAIVSFFLTNNVYISFLIVGLNIFFIILSGLNSQQKYNAFSKHKLIRSALTVIFALILYQIFGLNGIILGYFLSTLLILKELKPLIKNKKLDFSILKTKLKFISFTYSTSLSDVIFRWGDKMIIGILFGFSILGSFYFAVQYLLLLETFPRTLSIYFTPQEAKGKKNKKMKIFAVIISGLITVVSIATIPYVINMFIPKYEDSIIPIQIMSLAVIPLSVIGIQQSEFYGKENSKDVLMGSIIQSGFYLALIILLGYNFGLIGLAFGFLLGVISRMIFNFIIGKKLGYYS